MREALLIVPEKDNAGHSLAHVKRDAVTNLIYAFGGCTVRKAEGSWLSKEGKLHSEPVFELVAAYEPSQHNDEALERIARVVGEEGKQEAVYVRFASGDVRIIEMSPPVALAA